MNARWSAKRLPYMTEVGAMLLLLLSASCASAPPNLPFIATVAPQAAQPPSPTEPALPSAAVPTTAAASTPTAGEFALDLTPLPTETALPTLALPTESRFAGTFEIWDGLPTYLADSQPGFDFRVRYDPGAWARTTDAFGFPTLAHRSIAGCLIIPTGGRGLPLNGTVTHDVRRINGVSFQVNTAYVNGVRQFVNYVGGDGVIYTAFQVIFNDQGDQCLTDAEVVLGTLKAVSVVDATPITTP
jgi:hypothetical protein